jgi:NitT/TauT family transport system permease protein
LSSSTAVAPNKIRAARSLGASRAQVFGFVALPATVPYILTGMRLAMGNSFVTIIAAELVAANAGLGKMIWDARLYMLVDQIFVALLVLGLLDLRRIGCFAGASTLSRADFRQ